MTAGSSVQRKLYGVNREIQQFMCLGLLVYRCPCGHSNIWVVCRMDCDASLHKWSPAAGSWWLMQLYVEKAVQGETATFNEPRALVSHIQTSSWINPHLHHLYTCEV